MTISPPDPTAFRHVMGHFGSGVTVITTGSPESPVGFTASSVASLSLDPLLVMVGVATDGDSLAGIRESGAFGVNILSRDQEALAMHFARSDREARFRDVEVRTRSTGVPLLGASLAWLDCALHAEFPAGDHVVVVGRVESCDAGAGEPLLYFRGRFGGWLS
ncbi:flavin reductase family protein [Gaopeijia maritima]|uniref:Flavin reductase family protein n=2 Tax=Gaopeijia maritima TaxID=3119007 RepID=A0ABU9E7L9_9BACT